MNDRNEQAAEGQPPKATLLFVDDEENILSSLRRLFRPMGYTILTAKNGKDGLAVMASQAIDLVISDMRMPEMDGAAFLAEASLKWPETIRILLTGYADITSTIAAINKGSIYKYISKPWEDNDITITVRHALEHKYLQRERDRLHALTTRQNAELRDLNVNLEKKVEERTVKLREAMALLESAHESLKKNYTASVKIFSNLVEMRAGNVAGHSRRVAQHARTLSVKMGQAEDEVQNVLFAGLLHDIGKIALPDSLINRPFNLLGPEDRVEVQKHPVIGQGLLMALEQLHGAARLIRSHHERFDGRGFPDGLRGNAIPLGARILTVVNDYDALQQGTLTKEPKTPVEARAFVQENTGKRYDPDVVKVFFEIIDAGESELKVSQGVFTHTADLAPGMVLARDLVTRSGALLLSAGFFLEEKLIRKIQDFEKSTGESLQAYIDTRRR
ncbi:MAG: response regulator receiver [Gammaproteobacteria bacterium]|nr:MAG: response regulator receiver [Gammaproteobacteria bacterium]TND02444.1 MAG: response regulator receiver modulated metal dependent phosphohydrolase [Gammaproteobacteria bacterium]